MALIKCPECGRENISDVAESCPSCGYRVKEHFEKKIAERENYESQLKQVIEDKQRELFERQKLEQRINSVPMPKKPVVNKGFIVFVLIAIVFFSWVMLYVPETPNVVGWVMMICIFVVASVIMYCPVYFEQKKRYKFVQENFAEYQRLVIEEQDARNKRAEKERREQKIPRCPHCNSSEFEKITTVDRMLSVGMVGLASGKIGKQYKCLKCNHMW